MVLKSTVFGEHIRSYILRSQFGSVPSPVLLVWETERIQVSPKRSDIACSYIRKRDFFVFVNSRRPS